MADRLVVPSILGPVSVLTTSMRVRGYLSGATVTVMAIQGASSRVVAYGLLVGPEAMMPLVAGVSLRAGELLSASQLIGVLRSESLPPDQLTQVLRIHADVDGNVARSGLYSANGLQMLYRGAGDGEQIWFDASFIKGEDKDHGQSHLFVATLVVR